MPRLILLGALAALVTALLLGCASSEAVQPLPETVVGSLPEEEAPPPAEGPAGDPAAGAEVFASAGCASCHTLADAGASGTIGPSLDDAQPSYDRAVDVVTNGSGAMPAFAGQLDDQQIADVAAYVAEATAG